VYAGSTLFFDVCLQPELGPDGAWPLLSAEELGAARALFRGAAAVAVRQAGIVCAHGTPVEPPHCRGPAAAASRLDACAPVLPVAVVAPQRPDGTAPTAGDALPGGGLPVLDRVHAYYVATDCRAPVDADAATRAVVDHVTAGIRDAVVFGAGVECGLARAVDALLRRHIRTHVALDAAGAADPAEAQRVIADWKRRTVDVTTVAMVLRLLGVAPGKI